jgi:hypothetical protein
LRKKCPALSGTYQNNIVKMKSRFRKMYVNWQNLNVSVCKIKLVRKSAKVKNLLKFSAISVLRYAPMS